MQYSTHLTESFIIIKSEVLYELVMENTFLF